jgi:uracil-DNA glycosylase family 4
MATEVSRLARQLRQRLASLEAAGVEWLPAGSIIAPSTSAATSASSLFEAHEQIGGASSIEQRRHELTVVTERVAQCTRCSELAATRRHTVFGEGAFDAEICFIGEAPGVDEDTSGRPFVGAAGQLLNRIISACGMQREEVYICNILRCRPPGNRLPLPNEAANCREYLDRTLELIRPKYICCLGACAAQNLLGTTLSIGRLRGRLHDHRGISVLCTYHPAYLLRNPSAKKDVWEDMKMLLARMGRPVPAR